jgi:hypothetical protein
MAKRAVLVEEGGGDDFFILLGDDVEMLHGGWQSDVEERFVEISRERRLPYGCGCVALRDSSFEAFPTFPAVSKGRVPCIDVVVPTDRCDVSFLQALALLECKRDASVHTHVVVDQPDAPTLPQVRALASYAPNRTVRMSVLSENGGAAKARNAGLAQCFGDYCVLLDDDVVPQPGLLDAYLGALDREPGAAAYVGLTSLPTPMAPWERALGACRICYFYGIAGVVKNRPWGVTANICVRARTKISVLFSPVFPRTGGGEDVDFCIRSQMKGHGRLVGVTRAKVTHPGRHFSLTCSPLVACA